MLLVILLTDFWMFRVRIVVVTEGKYIRSPQLELATDESSARIGYGAWRFVQRSRSHR